MPINREREERELMRLTREHWSRKDTEWYIKNLLEREVKFAQQEQNPYDVLALLVGFSPDPLLQTIWLYQPQHIFLVFNHDYEGTPGRLMARRYRKWVKTMTKEGLLGHHPKLEMLISPNEATPNWVFRSLRTGLLSAQRDGKKIVVDITGAKKNMSVGAYLFAAYAGADISYVDFKIYDALTHSPLGYSCRIGIQANAYQSFGLRDWAHIQQRYDQFAFRGVIKATKGLADKSYQDGDTKIPVFEESEKKAISLLRETMTFLEAWESGDFTHAYQLWNRLKNQLVPGHQFTPPSAVITLGQANWPSVKNSPSVEAYHRAYMALKCGPNRPDESLFNRPTLLLTYAHDELDKIHRLIHLKEDARSAFLRAAGLNELLLKARIATLWLSGRLLVDGSNPSDRPDEHANFKKLANSSSADNMRLFLQDPSRWLKVGRRDKIKLWRADSKSLRSYWEGSGIDHDTLCNLRNEAIHTALSISPEIAKAAYELARFALDDYEKEWMPMLPTTRRFTYQSWKVSWDQLCQACGLDKFLPKVRS